MKHATTTQTPPPKKLRYADSFATLATIPALLFTILTETGDATKNTIEISQFSVGIYAEYLCYVENNN